MTRLTKLLRWTNLILILVTFISYLSPFVDPATFWPFAFVGIAYPWLLLANLLFVLFWAVAKDRYVFFSLCCIIMGWGHLTRFVGLGFGSVDQNDSSYVKVMTYNLMYLNDLRNGSEKSKRSKQQQFANMVNGQAPDIICFQETLRNEPGQMEAFIDLPHPYTHMPLNKRAAIYSKFPILKKGQVDFGASNNSCLWADVRMDEKTVRIYNLHLQSNRISSVADRVIKKGDLQEKETWSDIGGMIMQMKKAAAIRAEQARQVAAHIRDSPYPVIVCGDFNDTPQSYTYRTLAGNLKDGFCEIGSGIGTTYAGFIPALRIDYILSDPRMEFGECKVLREKLSDHYPVVGMIRLP